MNIKFSSTYKNIQLRILSGRLPNSLELKKYITKEEVMEIVNADNYLPFAELFKLNVREFKEKIQIIFSITDNMNKKMFDKLPLDIQKKIQEIEKLKTSKRIEILIKGLADEIKRAWQKEDLEHFQGDIAFMCGIRPGHYKDLKNRAKYAENTFEEEKLPLEAKKLLKELKEENTKHLMKRLFIDKVYLILKNMIEDKGLKFKNAKLLGSLGWKYDSFKKAKNRIVKMYTTAKLDYEQKKNDMNLNQALLFSKLFNDQFIDNEKSTFLIAYNFEEYRKNFSAIYDLFIETFPKLKTELHNSDMQLEKQLNIQKINSYLSLPISSEHGFFSPKINEEKSQNVPLMPLDSKNAINLDSQKSIQDPLHVDSFFNFGS